MKKSQTHLASLFVASTILLGLPLFTPSAAFAQPRDWSAMGLDCVAGPNNDVATIQGFSCLIANILSVAITIIALAAFAVFLFGSFKYMTSGGQSKGTEAARSAFTYAVVGIVVAVSAIIILNLVAAFTGIPILTEFAIPRANP